MKTIQRFLFTTIFSVFALSTVYQGNLFADPTEQELKAVQAFSTLMKELVTYYGYNQRVLTYAVPSSLEFVEVSPKVMTKIAPQFVNANGHMQFKMGSPKAEVGRDRDEDQVDVTLTKSFLMARTPITQLQYYLLTGERPVVASLVDVSADDYLALHNSTFKDGTNAVEMNANRPVMGLTWDQADNLRFHIDDKIKKLMNILGSEVKRIKFRLPTEAEWEYSARAGTDSAYYFGNKPIVDNAIFALNSGTMSRIPAPVGTKPSNALGFLDMSGNVANWCQDVFCDNLPGGINPLVTQDPEYNDHVHRGGSMYTCADKLRSAARSHSNSDGDVGVRLIMEF